LVALVSIEAISANKRFSCMIVLTYKLVFDVMTVKYINNSIF